MQWRHHVLDNSHLNRHYYDSVSLINGNSPRKVLLNEFNTLFGGGGTI